MLDGVIVYAREQSANGLLRSIVDVLLVYYVLYRVLLVTRGTRALQGAIGLGAVFLLYVVAQLLQLVTVLTILGALIQSSILVVVVVFQSDIRRALQRVGSGGWRWFGGWASVQESRVIDEVVDAASELARHRVGALIAFEQDANLDEFVGAHKGHEIDAKVSRDLLVALFLPEATNKLHDGAIIIRNFRIAKAGVFFPMPESRVIDASFGSRHRAALGITEETDAVVVIVSEERGSISLCFNGNIAADLPVFKLKESLESIFNPKAAKTKAAQRPRPSELPPAPTFTEDEPAISVKAESPPAPRVSEVGPPPTDRVLDPTPQPLKKQRTKKSVPTTTSSKTPITTPLQSSAVREVDVKGGRLEGDS